MTRKEPKVPNFLCGCGTTGNGYVLPLEVRRRLGFESELAAGREELKTWVEHKPQKCWDRRKLRPQFWGSLRKGVSYQTRTCEGETSGQAYSNYIGKLGRKFKVWVCSLFLLVTCSLCPANVGDSVFIRCFFLPANKLLHWWTKTEFRVFVNFSHGKYGPTTT